MYTPQDFKVADKEELFAFIKANAFGQLISLVDNQLFSSHIPFSLSADKQSLICHVAKRNPQWENIETQEVLITFQGLHDYISPSWYESGGVPTWNYQAVHVYGKPKLITEPEKLKVIVEELTDEYESAFERPWNPEYKESLLNMIVGIQINITEIQGKYKLSQNRPKEDQLKVIEELEKKGSTKLSGTMKKKL
jgi:transcriptional regulator